MDMSNPDAAIKTVLEEVVPFRFLSSQERRSLLSELRMHRFSAGEVIFRRRDGGDQVYLVALGLVETIDDSVDPPIRVNRITQGRYFGERSCLFNRPRDSTVEAVEETVLYSLSGSSFLDLIHSSRSFAQSLGSILREKQDIFAAFDTFLALLVQGIAHGSIDIRKLLPKYLDLEPALHPGAKSSEINFSAMSYAISRLPENVTRNFVYLLADDIPYEFSSPERRFLLVPTAARRRNVWEMLPGKSLVMLRNGISDLVDFVTCLCVYAVEARKIRKKIADPAVLRVLEKYNDDMPGESEAKKLLEGLPFSEDEIAGLEAIWGDDAPVRLLQAVCHREVLHIDIRRQTQSYNARKTDVWTYQVGNAARQLLGVDPSDLPESVHVHIISSNTHSVTNCLNPFIIEHTGEILSWARKMNHPLVNQEWHNEQDLAYALSREFMDEHPELAAVRQTEDEWGIVRLHETVSTGIQVQLIDLKCLKGYALDPDIGPFPGRNQGACYQYRLCFWRAGRGDNQEFNYAFREASVEHKCVGKGRCSSRESR